MNLEETVELREFDTLFVSGHATKPFCVLWSEDDKIALLLDDCVQVFELCPTPLSDRLTISFVRSWIPASTSLPLQNLIVDNKANSFVWKQNSSDVYDMALNSTLSTVIEKNPGTSFIIHCCFSPLICNESYLSCLTNNGALHIYKWNVQKWESVIDVSDTWIKYCHSNDSSQDLDYKTVKMKLYQLKIITMTWFNKPQLFFITGHEDGGICLWSVDEVGKTLKMNVYHYFHICDKPSYFEICRTTVAEKFLFIIGTMLGTVKCIPIQVSDEKKIKLGNEIDIWNYKDLMKPTLIKSEIINDCIYTFTIKNHIVLIHQMEINEDEGINILSTNWHEYSAPIVSFNSYQNNFIVGLRNHKFSRLAVNGKDYSVKEDVELPLKVSHTSCFHCSGLTMSKNKAIWVAVSSTKVNYDSKTMRDPTSLLIFVPKLKLFKNLSDTTSTGLIKQIAEKYNTTTLTEISDLLELKKYELLTDPTNYAEDVSVDNGLSPLDLKLLMWETKLKIFTQGNECQNLLSQCEYLLTLQLCENRRMRYLRMQSELTPLQRQSLKIMEIFIQKRDEGVSNCGCTCAVCGADAPFESVRLSTCSNSHTFPRCGLSLLPCDSLPYGFCRVCDSTVRLEFISDNGYRCVYCDGLLVPDNRTKT